MSEIEFRFIV